MFIYYHTPSHHTTPTKHHWKRQRKSKEVASETANADSHSNQITLISHQASYRLTAAAIEAVARVHVGRSHAQEVHVAAIAEGRGPPVTAAILIARRTTAVVARQRRR